MNDGCLTDANRVHLKISEAIDVCGRFLINAHYRSAIDREIDKGVFTSLEIPVSAERTALESQLVD